MLPSWIASHTSPAPDAEEVAERLRDLDAGGGTLWLLGPGDSPLPWLAAMARSWPGEVCAARLAGCGDQADVGRAIGEALGVPLIGEMSACGMALSRMRRPLLVLSEADVPEVQFALESLRALAPQARLLLGGRRASPPGATHSVPALPSPPAPAPTPLLHSLSLLRGGLPVLGDTGLAPELALPVPGRIVLHRPVADALAAQASAPNAALLALSYAQGLIGLALDVPSDRPLGHADVLLARFLVEHLPDPSDRIRLAAGGARLIARTGQPGLALDLLRSQVATAITEGHTALLEWAEGDVLLLSGQLSAATARHRSAIDRLVDSGDAGLAAQILRRTADALAALQLKEEAAQRYRRARGLHRDAGDALGVAASQRGVGDLAVSAGEMVGAEAIYEQAAATVDDAAAAPLERANLRLGQAALAIARGELSRAELLLQEAEMLNRGVPLLTAGICRRRADLLLRRGQHSEAMTLLERAIPLYQGAGNRSAAANTIRLRGDIAAAAGWRREAADHYQLALEESVRAVDLLAARRALHHLIVLERSGSDGDRVEELLNWQDELDTELAAPELRAGIRLDPE